MSAADGGPAFPQPMISTDMGIHAPDAFGSNYGGMSLRDHFAGQALVGICAEGGMQSPAHAAEWAYAHADAMLTERVKS